MNERETTCILIAGAQGCGKTTYALEMFNSYPKQGIIIDTGAGEEAFDVFPEVTIQQLKDNREKVKILYDESKDFFPIMSRNFANGIILFDDGMYFMADRKNENFRKLLMTRRQRNIDIVFICHGITEVPPSFWTFCTHLVLFKTIDNIKRAEKNAPQYDRIEKATIYVNEMSKKNPYHKEILKLR